MSLIKGMGSCAIPTEKNRPCGRQIQEGEPIGTVMMYNNPVIGHKSCAEGYQRREQEKKMKIGRQDGPGGSIGDPRQYPDALAFGSTDLEKKEPPDPGTEGEGQLNAGVNVVTQAHEPAVSPEVLATLQSERHQSSIDEEEQKAIAKLREEYAAKRKELTEAPVIHSVNVDLSQVPVEADVLEIRLDLRKLRP